MLDTSKFTLKEADYKLADLPIKAVVVPVWNRLESKPRGQDLSRSLSAQLRDPLWMLCRQWQMGEFVGEDAGTLTFTNLVYNCTPVAEHNGVPLEVQAEKMHVFNDNDVIEKNLDIRIQMANYWLRLLPANLKTLKPKFLANKKYALPDPATFNGDIEERQFLSLYYGRSFDGYKFLNDETSFDLFTAAQKQALLLLFTQFKEWYTRTYAQPEINTASKWQNTNLEYRFNVTASTKSGNTSLPLREKSLTVEEYHGGKLEWYNFKLMSAIDVTDNATTAAKIRKVEYDHTDPTKRKLMPVPMRFDGMPESRFWAFEDGGTNFAALSVDKLDIAKLAIIEFAMIYSNDWSVIPIKVPAGSLIDVASMSVIDSFGKSINIKPVNAGATETWRKWSFFSLDKITSDTAKRADGSIFFPPVVSKIMQGRPIEEVKFIRDEMANLVWGIESIVSSPIGIGKDGNQKNKEIVTPKGEKLRYQPINRVPLNWIPFAAVVNDNNKTVLRRGKMLDEFNTPVYPNNSILRPGLSKLNKVNKTLDIQEHEIGREGIVIKKYFQRTRWTNGEVFTWVGLQKVVGKGEGHSGLAFDQLANEA